MWKDCNGKPIHDGDTVFVIEKGNIGVVRFEPRTKKLFLKTTKQYSHKLNEMVPVPAGEVIEREMVPKHSKLYWLIHNYKLKDFLILEGY